MDSHRQSMLSGEGLLPILETGCGVGSILRKDLAAHLEKDVQQHMLDLFKSHIELKKKYKKQKPLLSLDLDQLLLFRCSA